MQVIYSCLVIVFFIIGTGFGYCIGKNGFIQIGSGSMPAAEKNSKKTVEEQLEDLMRYDGGMAQRKDKQLWK